MAAHKKHTVGSLMKYLGIVGLFAGALAIGSNASAQQAGEYDGQTADGLPVQIIVAVDQSTGKFEIQGVGFNFTLLCQKSGDHLGESWGVFPAAGADIIKGKFSDAVTNQDDYLPFSMTFKGKKSVSGDVALTETDFNPAIHYNTPPKKEQYCSSDEKFTATFSGAPKLKGKAGTMTIRSRNTSIVASLKH